MQDTAIQKRSDLVTVRDTVESIWIAIVLAFVLRAFIVEAFVIPTGSMAPRLLGEHWDLQCQNCGYQFAFGWPGGHDPLPRRDARQSPAPKAHCPNCSAEYPNKPEFINAGDRVLVMKYLYHFAPPQPWDVVVFKNPQNNHENYIKRLIGLPGETIEIIHGDIFFRTAKTPWQVRRKGETAQEAMWQVVFDNDYQCDKDAIKQWKPQAGKWETAKFHGRRFAFEGGPRGEMNFQAPSDAFLPHYGYNPVGEENRIIDASTDICTDLKLAAVFIPSAADSHIGLHLTSFENRFKAEIAADGHYAVYRSPALTGDDWTLWTAGDASVAPLETGVGHDVSLACADYRLTLKIDGQIVYQSTDAEFRGDHDSLKDRMMKVEQLPIPIPQVRISAWGSPSAIWHVKLLRDVYYTSFQPPQKPEGPLGDYAATWRKVMRQDLQHSWGTMGHPIELKQHPEDRDLDSFFVLGDNSPQSLDGRGWASASPTLQLWKPGTEANPTPDDAIYQMGTVPRYNLIGRAFFVYWPAGFRPPGLDLLPLVPNVGKMRLIR